MPILGNVGIFSSSIGLFISLSIVTFLTISNLFMNKRIPIFSIQKKYIVFFLLFWCTYSLLSVFWVKDKTSFLLIFINLLIIIVTIVVFFLNNFDLDDLVVSLKYLIIPTLFHIINGLNEIVNHKYLFTNNIYITGYIRNRLPVSSMFNTNNYATVLCFLFGLILFLFFIEKNKIMKFVFLISFCIISYLIIMTQSRANIISITLMILTMYILYRREKKMTFLSYFLSISLAFIFLFYIFSLLDNTDKIIDTYVNSIFNSVQSNSERFNLLKNGAYFFISSKGLGVGLGNTEYHMMNRAIYPTNGVINLHNFFGEIIVSSGWIIFTLFFLGYFYIIKKSSNNFANYSKANNLKFKYVNLFLVSYVISFIFSGVSTSNLFQLKWFWMIFSIILITFGTVNSSNIKKGE